MDINIEFYKVFYIVAKYGNITKASDALQISQPAISKSIKKLEEQLGCVLFTRNKRGVTLTHEGEVFYQEIEKAMAIIDTAESKIKELIQLDYGELNIGASKSITELFLLPYIKRYHQKYPNINIKIYTEPYKTLFTKARNGNIDFIALTLPYDIPQDFKVETTKEITDCFFASNQFKELKGKTITFQELVQYPLVLVAKGSSTRTFLEHLAAQKNVPLIPKFDITSNSLGIKFVKAGLGIGFTSKEYIKEELENGSLFEVKLKISFHPRKIGFICVNNQALSNAAKKFSEQILEKE